MACTVAVEKVIGEHYNKQLSLLKEDHKKLRATIKKFAQDEFFLDSINEFRNIIHKYPDSELADDALYNIGLCYFNMQQFDKSISYFETVIKDYSEGTISILDGGNEFGKTSAKITTTTMDGILSTTATFLSIPTRP